MTEHDSACNEPPIGLLHEPESKFQIQPDMAVALRNPASDE